MNFKTWSGKKKVFALLIGLLVLVGIVITVYLVQKQQETRSHANKATVLSLAPPNQNINPSDHAKLDVMIDPGTNQVNFVKLVVRYDPNKFGEDEQSFSVNPSSNLKVVSGPSIRLIPGVAPEQSAEISVSLGIGSDPTKVIQSPETIGTFTFNSNADDQPSSTVVSFSSDTQVRSVGGGDVFNENVLSSTNPATITITSGICRPNISTCSWNPVANATSYHYVIDQEQGQAAIVQEGDTSNTSVEFPSTPGNTYTCKVTASNECGTSGPSQGTSTCPVPSLTLTPTLTPTPGPSSTPTLTPTPTVTLTPTPTVTLTPTIPGKQVTPTTSIEIVTATPIPTNIIVQGPTGTPKPTLPATGNPLVNGGIIGGVLFVLGGLALLLL